MSICIIFLKKNKIQAQSILNFPETSSFTPKFRNLQKFSIILVNDKTIKNVFWKSYILLNFVVICYLKKKKKMKWNLWRSGPFLVIHDWENLTKTNFGLLQPYPDLHMSLGEERWLPQTHPFHLRLSSLSKASVI